MRLMTTPEPLELIELEPLNVEPEAPARRPVPSAFRLLAPPAAAWTTTTLRRHREPLWVEARPRTPAPWPDLAVRRLVEVPFSTCCEELPTILAQMQAVRVTVVARTADETRLLIAARPPSRLHPVAIELTLRAWSPRRVELRLELHARKLHVSQGRYDVAHDLAETLRNTIECHCGSTDARAIRTIDTARRPRR